MKKKIHTWIIPLLLVLGVIVGIPVLMFLEHTVSKAKEAQVPNAEVRKEEKDLYNGYGLEGDTKLSTVLISDKDGVVCYEDRIFPHFACEEEQITNIVDMANAFVEKSGLDNLYIVPIPGRYVIEDAYEADLKAYTEYVGKLSTALGETGKFVDVLPLLKEHEDEYVFFRTEDSWTHRGAYYGTAKICEEMSINPLPLKSYHEYMYNGFKGTELVEYGDLQILEDMAGDRLYYYISPNGKNQAMVELENGDWVNQPAISESRLGVGAFIENIYLSAVVKGNPEDTAKKEESLLLVCDARGKLLAQYFSNYYKNVYVINIERNKTLRASLPQIKEEYNIQDVVWAQCVDNMGDSGYSRSMSRFLEE